MKESAVQKKITDRLTNAGYKVFKVMGANSNGVSDLIACSPRGKFIAIEVKAPGKLGTVSKLQEHFLEAVRVRGGSAILADSVEIVEKALDLRTP